MREELAPRLVADVAGGDRNRPDPALTARVRDVHRVLHEDHGVVVREGDAVAAKPLRSLREPSGEAASASVSIWRDFEMSQFWQKRHARLQPAVPNESTAVPGRK